MEPKGSLPHLQEPPPVPILRQLDPVHIPTSHFLKIYLNIIPPSKPGFPKRSLFLRFPHQNPVYTYLLPHTRYMPRPSNSRFYHPNNIEYRSLIRDIINKFKVCKSVHHHTIQINQPNRCNNFSSLLLDVYVQLNMFRAFSHPSSGAQLQ